MGGIVSEVGAVAWGYFWGQKIFNTGDTEGHGGNPMGSGGGAHYAQVNFWRRVV
jgi:hypothetical protein